MVQDGGLRLGPKCRPLGEVNLSIPRADIFDYIEMFYNVRRRHGSNSMLSPVDYEQHHEKQLESV